MKPTIDNEFYGLIDPPTAEELNLLEESIKKDGCRDPLVIWKEKEILLDGHNRFDICTRLKVPYDVKFLSFKTREDAADWIDANQMGRRNLTEIQKSVIRGRRYNRTKGKQGGDHGNQHTKLAKCTPRTLANSADNLADEYGVSKRTIKKDGEVAEAVDNLSKKLNLKPSEVTAKDHTKKDIIAAAEVVETKPELAKKILSGEATAEQKDKIGKALGINEHELICAAVLDAHMRLERAASQTDLKKASDEDFKRMNNALAGLVQKIECMMNTLADNFKKGNRK